MIPPRGTAVTGDELDTTGMVVAPGWIDILGNTHFTFNSIRAACPNSDRAHHGP